MRRTSRTSRPRLESLEAKALLSATAEVVGHTLQIAVHQDQTAAGVFWKDSSHREIDVEFDDKVTGGILQFLRFDGTGLTSVRVKVVGNDDSFVADFEDPAGLLPVRAVFRGDRDQFLGMAEPDRVTMFGSGDTADGGGGDDHIRIVETG